MLNLSQMKNLAGKWWFKAALFGLIIRIILMPITLHPDLWGHSFTAYFFAQKGVFNVYEHLVNLPSSHPLVANFGVSDIFIYPPLTYFTLGIFRLLVSPFTDSSFIPWLWSNLGSVHEYSGLYWHLFLFKLPYLFFDMAAAFLISSLFDNPQAKSRAFALWMFNPLTLYATFMMGQLDILPTFFVILSLYFAKKEKPYGAVLSLGVGGAYKMYPLLLLPLVSFVLVQNFWPRLRLMIVGLIPFVLTVLPFLSSSAFRSMVLFSPKNQKMLFMGFHVTAAEVIYPFIFLMSLLYFLAYYKRNKVSIYGLFMAALLLIFSVSHFHPQWFLWASPLLIWFLVKNDFYMWELVAILLVSWLILTFLFEPSLSYGLFNPLFPALDSASSLEVTLSKFTDVFMFKSIIRSIFAASAIYISTKALYDKA